MPAESKPATIGAAPEGTRDQRSAARAVRDMFTSIAPRYDLANHVLSLNIDRIWWRRTARTFTQILQKSDARVLDLCCGTGDMAFALHRMAAPTVRILGADFSRAMLQLAQAKTAGQPLDWIESDALQLPFPGDCFDLITSAFGFRNLADYDAGLREIVRVLKPGGECGILDFGEPTGIVGKIYRLYFRRILPRLGTLISGVSGPYAYLPASVERFPHPSQMLDRMRAAGLSQATWTPYTFGIAGLYRGKK